MSKLFTIFYILIAYTKGLNFSSSKAIRGFFVKDRNALVRISKDSRVYELRVSGCGEVVIESNVEIRGLYIHVEEGAIVRICKGAYIGMGVKMSSFTQIEIGEDTLIAPNCVLIDNDHKITGKKIKYSGVVSIPTIIGSDCWIGANCVIGKGVKMRHGSTLGCQSYLNKDTDAHSINFGIPAKKKHEG